MKGDTKTSNIPVVITSNLGDAGDIKSTKALGADEYFIKSNTEIKKIIQYAKAKTILIVEDEKSLAEALVEKLTKDNFIAKVAKNGREGLKSALRNHPDLILLDIVMPVMDGMAMLKELRNDQWGKSVPVIILTNLSEAEKTATALDEGVKDYLVKTDWKLSEVVEKIKERLA